MYENYTNQYYRRSDYKDIEKNFLKYCKIIHKEKCIVLWRKYYEYR
ncbi:hypothetical protein HMPREF9129_0376 [Peptoniphilus indolicus ATCC 29427]|uniref:Uncharacterized protein n=1 Tax=Peptoniphilus indolicus ATCC 29427 TaxID=997350 RepID=G4D1U6_9FIRM|nr:hypothetical protein HMPREF9129_0376 [Peptoniphilus indolicus ATCC 29427]